MAGRPMGVFLLVLLTAVVSVKGFCPGNGTWHYHDPTRTCMSLRTEKSTYANAEIICKGFLGSSDRKTPGHLVYIFEKVTDDFVKGLLNKDSAMALIGLYYHSRSGYHKWEDTNRDYESYNGWAAGEGFNIVGKSSVVITKSGWKTHSQDTETEFVCQVEISVGLPTISCPPVEVGQPGSITCTIELPNDKPLSPELRIKSNEQVELSCTSQRCWKDSVEAGAISRSWTSQNRTVQRSDEGEKICIVKFENGPELTSIPCHLEVYSLPSKVECEVNYFQTTMNVTCTSTRMYPKPDCQWNVTSPNNSQLTTTSETTGYIEDTYNGLTYYKAVCRRTLSRPVAGTYLFEVSVYPSVSDLKRTHPSSVTRGSLNVVVEVPNLPELYDSQWASITSELGVKEKQTATINCQIRGGEPEVYRTFINCYPHPPQEASGSQVSVTFAATQSFHNQSCRCQGYHLTGPTRDVSLKLLVLSAPRITSFTLNGRRLPLQFEKNDNLSLRCEATGYPQPRLSLLYYQDTLKTPVIGYHVTNYITATCRSMGKYTCLAENNAQQKDVKHVHLQIRCAPEYCLGTEQLPKYGAAVNSNATVQMCVHVYPVPRTFLLSKSKVDRSEVVPRSRYEVNFTYTGTGRGTITVTILSVRQEDFGEYHLFTSMTQSSFRLLHSTLDFELVPRASTPIGFDTTLPTLAQTTPAQTTQSDSTVRYTTERVTSYDSTTAATQPSTVSYGTSESTRLPIRNDFECHLTYMDVFLPEELAPNSVLKLRNSSCQLSYNGSHYVTSFSYNECGTTQEYYYTNLILVKNEITVHVKLDKSDSIQFAADYTIPLTCVVRVNSTAVSGSFQVVDRDPFSPQYGHSPDLVLREYANGRYEDEITQYPVKVPINREIFFELAVTQSREDGNGIKIDKCEATPTPDANDTVRYLLISDGCPASPAVRIIPSPGKYRIRFIVQTFHFNVPANQSNLVYVHCYASGCQQFGCYRPCLGFKRRRRSSNHRVSTSIASSGSHIIVPE